MCIGILENDTQTNMLYIQVFYTALYWTIILHKNEKCTYRAPLLDKMFW